MTSESQSYLRFSVEESVWFQKGQEVSELVSISLDPNIVIQENNQYVSIRGALELSGEYRIDEESTGDDTRDYTSVRVVNEVTTREDGVSELKHSFPVDITIPKNRIQNMDDVYVAIESFDYELPKRGCLQLVADLSISGIYGSQQSVPTVEDTSDESEQPLESVQRTEAPSTESEQLVASTETPETPLEEPPAAYLSKEVVDEKVQEPFQELETKPEPESEPELEPELELAYRSSDKEDANYDVQSVNVDFYTSSQEEKPVEEDDNLFSPFEVEARKEQVEEEVVEPDRAPDAPTLEVVPDQEVEPKLELVEDAVEELVEEEPEPVKQPSLQVEFKGRPEGKYDFGSRERKSVTAVEDREEVQEEDNAPVAKSENALYLTKIFARDDEEDFTKMRICIAQQGDSLDKVSERYGVTIQALVRVNQLSDGYDVNEGQLLYIPTK